MKTTRNEIKAAGPQAAEPFDITTTPSQFHGNHRTWRRVLLAMAGAGAAAMLSGCLSVHTHSDKPAQPQVIVVPNDQPVVVQPPPPAR